MSTARKDIDSNEIKRLWALGMNVTEIAIKVGCSRSTVDRHLKSKTNAQADLQKQAVDRLTQQAYGFVLAAEQIDTNAIDVDNYTVEQWLADLNRLLKSVKGLRTQLREKLQ